MPNMAESVSRSARSGHSPSLYVPNRLHNGLGQTVLEVRGALRDIGMFRYCVGYDTTEILTERLEANGKMVFSQDRKELSLDGRQKRFYERERLLDIYKVECLNQDGTRAASSRASRRTMRG